MSGANSPTLIPRDAQPITTNNTSNNISDLDIISTLTDIYAMTSLPYNNDTTMDQSTPETNAGADDFDLPNGTMDLPSIDMPFNYDLAPIGSEEEQPSSDGLDDEPEEIEQPAYCGRQLRPAREGKREAPRTWIDADTTGDFDPLEEARKLRARRKKAKLTTREPRERTTENFMIIPGAPPRPQTQPPPALHLTFHSPLGKAAFSELCKRLLREVKPACDDFSEGYQLRKRKGVSDGRHVTTSGAQANGVDVPAFEAPNDLKNHPAARGCHGCLGMGLRCSLLDNEHSWPCEDCKATDEDCYLITEPEMKLACSRCQYLGKRDRGLVCSNESEEDPLAQRGPCKKCKEDGHCACIAGPRPGYVRTRTRIGADDKPFTNEPAPALKSVRTNTCRQCLDARRPCSFTGQSPDEEEGGICTACDMSGHLCEPLGLRKLPRYRACLGKSKPVGARKEEQDDLALPDTTEEQADSPAFDTVDTDGQDFITITSSPPRAPARPSRYARSRQTVFDPWMRPVRAWNDREVITLSSSPPPIPAAHRQTHTTKTLTPQPQQKQPKSVGGTIKEVQTKFCHPISFIYDDLTPDSSLPCHFCSCAHYSILGLDERNVEVIEWHDGRGLEEISGGHKGNGVQCTRVCYECTMARMRVMVCTDHALRRTSVSEVDVTAALENMVAGEQSARERICTVCCNTAEWECCAEQPGETEHREGCGLVMCGRCATELGRHGGELESMLQDAATGPTEERQYGLRADYELLKQDGLLMKYVTYTT